MVWARIPPDRLDVLPLFGIDIVARDPLEPNIVWMRGPSGRIAVDVRTPRIWFESVADAHQAGATAIRISTSEEESEAREYSEKLAREADDDQSGSTGP